MKKKTLACSILTAFLCCIMILGFRTNVKAAGNFYIKVNKATNVVTVYTQNNQPYTAFVCSTGAATPIGTFYTPQKYTWWLLDGPSYGQYCTRITGAFLFHSVWYFQQDKTTQSYVQYNKLGTQASHGCIRLTVSAAKWIYDNCPLQTKVIIFNGTSDDDPLGKPPFIRVSSSVSMGWDPTDPDPANPYNTKNTQPRISVKKKTVSVQYKSKFQPVEMTAYDSAGNALSRAWIRTSGTVDTNKMGNYPVTYSVTDSFGRDASVTVTYQVGDVKKATITGVKKSMTKEYGKTIDLRKKIKAKSSLGVVLTDKVVVRVCKPGSSVFKKTASQTLELDQVGTYQIMYYLKNPSNKLVTEKITKVIVKDTKKPVFTSTNNFSPIKVSAGTKSITFKKLRAGVKAALRSGKNMTSKISIKVTDANGKIKTVAKDGSYQFNGPGKYTITYYCANTVKNLKTDTYMVAKKNRRLIVEPATIKSTVHKIIAPADETVTVSGSSLQLLADVSVKTTHTMTDGTKKEEQVTQGITYTVTYQADALSQATQVVTENDRLLFWAEGIYTITYQYTGAEGKSAQSTRVVTFRQDSGIE